MEAVITEPISKEFLNEMGEIIYPDSDGQPMADNTKQFEWIATIKGNLDSVFAKATDVFVAGDLLWYPVQGSPKIRVAPDVMVAFGRPKGYRGSYKQWEEGNVPPQVVFEILSPGNTVQEMNRKFAFYMRFGVEEYYLYDPYSNLLSVFRREGHFLQEELIEQTWISPLMNISFELQADNLLIKDTDGKPFLTYLERAEAEKEALKREEEERKAKEQERKAKEDALAQVKEEEKAISEKDAEIQRLKELLEKSGYSLS